MYGLGPGLSEQNVSSWYLCYEKIACRGKYLNSKSQGFKATAALPPRTEQIRLNRKNVFTWSLNEGPAVQWVGVSGPPFERKT